MMNFLMMRDDPSHVKNYIWSDQESLHCFEVSELSKYTLREAHEEILYVWQHMYTSLPTGPELEELVDLPIEKHDNAAH